MVADARSQLAGPASAVASRRSPPAPALHGRRGAPPRHARCLYRLLDIGPVDCRRTDGRLRRDTPLSVPTPPAAEHHPPAYKQLAIPPPAPVGPIGPAHQEPPTPWCSPTPAPWGHNTSTSGHSEQHSHAARPEQAWMKWSNFGAGGADPRSPSLLDLGAATPLAHRPQPRGEPAARQEPQRVGGHRLGAGRHGSEAEARTADANGLVNASPIGTEHDLRLPLPEFAAPHLWVADVNYHPLWTPLLTTAHALVSGSCMVAACWCTKRRSPSGCSPAASRTIPTCWATSPT